MGFGQIKRHLKKWGVVQEITNHVKRWGGEWGFVAKVAGKSLAIYRRQRKEPLIDVSDDYVAWNKRQVFWRIRMALDSPRLIHKGVYASIHLLSWKSGLLRVKSLDQLNVELDTDQHPLLTRVFCDYAALGDQVTFMALKDLLIDQVPPFVKEMERIQ